MNWCLHTIGLAMALAWLMLALASHHPPVRVAVFLGIMAVAWAALAGAMRFAEPLSWRAVLGWAIVFRLLGICALPIFEDDWYRYLWDGWRLISGEPVYGVPPIDFFYHPDVPLKMERVLDGINHPELPTLYGPVAQLFFGGATALKPVSLVAFKCLWLGLDLFVLCCLRRQVSPAGFLFYAWCPLLVFEVFFNGHFEVVGLALLVAGWMLSEQKRFASAGVCLALATGARWFVLPLVPLLLRGGGVRGCARGADVHRDMGIQLDGLRAPPMGSGETGRYRLGELRLWGDLVFCLAAGRRASGGLDCSGHAAALASGESLVFFVDPPLRGAAAGGLAFRGVGRGVLELFVQLQPRRRGI